MARTEFGVPAMEEGVERDITVELTGFRLPRHATEELQDILWAFLERYGVPIDDTTVVGIEQSGPMIGKEHD